MLWLENWRPKLLVQLFSEFETFYCLSSSDCRSMTSPHVQCTVDLFTQTDGLAVQSHSPQNPFFSWCSTVPPWPLAWDLIPLFSTQTVATLCLQTLLESDRALRSSWRQSLCPVWSRLWPSPSCPKVYLSIRLSSPAVALASHLGGKSPCAQCTWLYIVRPRA